MIHTFRAHDAVELAVLERSGFVESVHIGSAVVVAGDGSVVTELGDINAPIYPRSAMKPFQALAAMQSGVPLRGAQVAIAAGSHAGSLEHMDVVSGMLKAAGLNEAHLGCPAAWPRDADGPGLAGAHRTRQVQAGHELLRQACRVPLGLHRERLGHRRIPGTQPPHAARRAHSGGGIHRRIGHATRALTAAAPPSWPSR